jgi:methylenetetrahydrofolate reductase (NADPH)
MAFHISFEFFPPRTEAGVAAIPSIANHLMEYQPDFFSVTFGAGGSTQQKTLETVQTIRHATSTPTAPHISCIGATRERIREMILNYRQLGIDRLVVLRGDVPPGTQVEGDFRYANELLSFIREETGSYFHISVGAYPEYHPQATSPDADFDFFKQKVHAGANMAITQYFFNPDAYFEFLDNCAIAGLNIPVIPGIMPLTNYQQIARFSDICGAEIPKWIRQKLAHYDAKGDTFGLQEFGEHVITQLCETLVNNGAPGLHFYTLNKFEPTHHILQNLSLSVST